MLNNLFLTQVSLSKEIPEDNYISDLPVVRHLKEMKKIDFKKPVTFIVGENGTGKSTLIEAIAVAMGFNAEGGTINFNFSTESTHSDLHKYIKIIRGTSRNRDGFFLRAESFYNLASYLEGMDRDNPGDGTFDCYGGVSLHNQSHGESFMSLIENRFGGNGLYILDEPEAALSPMRLLRLMANINALVERGSQFIISTHSPILMALPKADVLELTENGIQRVKYQDTEHFQLTKDFVNSPETFLRYLLE